MSDKVLILSGADVDQLTAKLSALELTRLLGKTLHAITADSHAPTPAASAAPPIQNPLRIATSCEAYKTLYMPSRLTTAEEGSSTAIKIVAVPTPAATLPGLPASTLLFDEHSGKLAAVVNASELTAIRTAAASAAATRLLADPAARRLVVFGTGAQAYWHARLVLELLPSVGEVIFVARAASGRATGVVLRVQGEFEGVEVALVTAEQAGLAVREADIICTCVPSTDPVFDLADLKPNVHINAIGSYQPHMQEFPPALISPSTPGGAPVPVVLVDVRTAVLAEAGEVIAAGVGPESLVELGEVVGADGEGVEGAVERLGLRRRGRSVFKCVGVGGMDVAVTGLVVRAAKEAGVGTYVEF